MTAAFDDAAVGMPDVKKLVNFRVRGRVVLPMAADRAIDVVDGLNRPFMFRGKMENGVIAESSCRRQRRLEEKDGFHEKKLYHKESRNCQIVIAVIVKLVTVNCV